MASTLEASDRLVSDLQSRWASTRGLLRKAEMISTRPVLSFSNVSARQAWAVASGSCHQLQMKQMSL